MDTPSALQPYPLTQDGEQEVRRQARLFGEWLAASGRHLDPKVDASSLLRAWQTAEIYIEELQGYFVSSPDVTCYPALCERSVGAVANLPISEIERIMALDPRIEMPPQGWKSDSHYCLPFDGAESLLQAGERVAGHISAWSDQRKQEPNNLIKLFIGHGASIRHAAFHMNVINFCDIKKLSMYYGHPVVFELADNGDSALLFGNWKQRQIHDVPD